MLNTKRLIDITEVSNVLNLKKSTIYAWVHQKKIPYVKIGGRLQFIEEQIMEFIYSNNYKPESL